MPPTASLQNWKPDPVQTFPVLATITFNVTPGPDADKGIRVSYTLNSGTARFDPEAPQPPGLREDEAQNSQPALTDPKPLQPRSRGNTMIVDEYPLAEKAKQFALKRAVHVIGGPGTEMASIIVVVADIDAQGTPVPIPAKTKMFKIDVSHHT